MIICVRVDKTHQSNTIPYHMYIPYIPYRTLGDTTPTSAGMVLPLVASNLEIFFPPRIEKKVLFVVGEERGDRRSR